MDGSNETGFSIMNTASYNLKDDDIKEMDQEGNLMRKALRVCKTVQDFEHFLDTLPRPMRVEANFGVIDAYGGAAYYETNNERYYKKDANDPNLAPEGYLFIRISLSRGVRMKAKGMYVMRTRKRSLRKCGTEDLLLSVSFNRLPALFIIACGYRFDGQRAKSEQSYGLVCGAGFHPSSGKYGLYRNPRREIRHESGIDKMWTALGYPPTSVAIPLWVKMGKEQSALVTYDASYKTALLDWYSVQLQKNVYSIHRGNGQKYLHWQLLWNDDQSGYIQQLRAVENRIFDLFDAHKTEWEQNGLDTKEIQRLYKEVDKLVNKAFLGLQKS